MHRYRILIFAALAARIWAAQPSVPVLADVLSQLEKQHGTIQTIAVEFRQEKVFSFLDKPIVSHGFLLFESPDKIRFDIIEPFASSLLNDGQTIRRYEKIDGQWKPLAFGGGKSIQLVLGQISQWMQGKFAGQDELFATSIAAGDPNDYAVLTLEPRASQFRRYIEKIAIHIACPPSVNISQIAIYEPNGDNFCLLFSKELRNIPLPEGGFREPAAAEACAAMFKRESGRFQDTKQ